MSAKKMFECLSRCNFYRQLYGGGLSVDVPSDVVTNCKQILSTMIPRKTSELLPDVEDADPVENVLAFDSDTGVWVLVQYDNVAVDSDYTFWLPVPEHPEVQ